MKVVILLVSMFVSGLCFSQIRQDKMYRPLDTSTHKMWFKVSADDAYFKIENWVINTDNIGYVTITRSYFRFGKMYKCFYEKRKDGSYKITLNMVDYYVK